MNFKYENLLLGSCENIFFFRQFIQESLQQLFNWSYSFLCCRISLHCGLNVASCFIALSGQFVFIQRLWNYIANFSPRTSCHFYWCILLWEKSLTWKMNDGVNNLFFMNGLELSTLIHGTCLLNLSQVSKIVKYVLFPVCACFTAHRYLYVCIEWSNIYNPNVCYQSGYQILSNKLNNFFGIQTLDLQSNGLHFYGNDLTIYWSLKVIVSTFWGLLCLFCCFTRHNN